VKTQIWIAVSVYVLAAIVCRRLDLKVEPYPFLQVVSVAVFEKLPIQAALSPDASGSGDATESNQLNLLGF
jgi:hypothetical protein